jgi:hypothetical protein
MKRVLVLLITILLWSACSALPPVSIRIGTAQPTALATPSPGSDDAFIDSLARDTWAYLNWAASNHLPWSWRSESPDLAGGDYSNPAEIGLYMLCWLGAYELHRPWSPGWSEVETELMALLDQLSAWQTGVQSSQPHGPNAYASSVFYQWYWVSWHPPVVGTDGRSSSNHVVPSIDNAWLAASLITLREYAEANGHPELGRKASAILGDMNFTPWYSSATHRFVWGGREDPRAGTAIDYYSNENRIINFTARALDDLDTQEFQLSLSALEQNSGTYGSITVSKIAWDGSMFTYLAPALFIREMETSYGRETLLPIVQAQMAYARDQGYPVWGLSDCFDIGDEEYVQQGSPPAASPGPLETRPGLVSPHASALALITPVASEALANLQTLQARFPDAYHPHYGFRDCIMAKPGPDYGRVSERFSALAQEWLFLSIVNMETGLIWDYFYQDEGVRHAHEEMYPEQ